MRSAKRYVLLSTADGSAPDWREAVRDLAKGFAEPKLIPLEETKSAVVIRTNNRDARLIRERAAEGRGKGRIITVLTSGSIGKLKRTALERPATEIGQVLER